MTPKPLTKAQLKEAAKNRTPVRYVMTFDNPNNQNIDYLAIPSIVQHGEDAYCDLDSLDNTGGDEVDITDLKDDDPIYWDFGDSIEVIYSGEHGTTRDQLREKLAKFLHEDIWAHWMKYLFDQCIVGAKPGFSIPPEKGSRWVRQMNTSYEDLPEEEKKSDRELAEKLMKLLEE